MCHIASEMEKRNMNIPIIIGGATTSKPHTALKIAPNYSGAIVHGYDASKTVEICKNLLGKNKYEYIKSIKKEYVEKLELEENKDIFDLYRVENQIEKALSKKVWLKSGGYLIKDKR